MKRARVLVVIIQLLLLSLPIHADFDPSNPPEPNVTHRLTVLMTPSDIGYCGSNGSYRAGDGVHVYSYPYDWNYKLKYWTINGYKYHETGNDFWYTMGDSAVTFIAYYEYEQPTPPPFEPGNPPEPYVKQNITVDIDPEEAGYTDGTGSYSYNDGIYICAYIDYEYEFEYWTVNGYPWPETSHCFYYQVGDTNAHFVAHVSKKHMITLKTQPRAAGTSTMQMNGMPISDQLVARGKKLDFSTIGNEDYKFSHWTINGYKHTTSSSFNYTVGDSAAAVVAMYDYIGTGDTTLYNPDSPPEPDLRFDVTIIVVSENDAKGTTDGGGTYVYGTTDTLYAYPAEGFEFRYWNDGVQDNPRIIYATQDSLFVAYFGNDTIARTDTICYGEHLQIGDVILNSSGHYEFYTPQPDGVYIWNIVDLTVLDRIYTDLDTTICYGETYEHDGIVYDASGTYTRTYQNARGCDSTVTINLNILPKIDETIIDTTICYGASYYCDADGMTYTETILNKTITLTNMNGCDSVVILNLTVLSAVPVTVIDTVTCNGVPFYWSVTGQTYSGTQVVNTTLTDVHGCDSVVRLNLVELSAEAPIIVYDTTCYGVPYTWNITGKQYTGSCVVDTIVKSDIGCDIWMILNLTELPDIPTTEIDTTICYGEAYYFRANGKVYTTSVDTTITLQDMHGCDSLVHLNLTVLPEVPVTVINTTICYGETYLWHVNGVSYDATTIVSDTILNANGCDSILTLYLTVLPEAQPVMDSININDGSAVTWNGVEYTKSGEYTTTLNDDNGCPQLAYLHLYISSTTYIDDAFCQGDIYTWQGHYHADGTTPLTFTSAGTYTDTIADINGNDSICVLTLEEVPMPNLVVRPDTMIYPGESVLLWATGADYISWSPTEYITQTDELTSYATPLVTTTYTATGYNMPEGGGNLVYNGNFDLGNVGFETDCSYFEPYGTIGGWGTYTIADDVQGFWGGLVGSTKAYGGSGNMMILDGYTTAHSVVWSQTVTVQPHSFYAFSAQIMSAWDSNIEGQYALLQFAVNDEPVGPIFHSPDELYTWEKFYNVWYSGDNTTAVLTIYNQNDNPYGNDFALDEIQFAQLHEGCEDSKTVTIAVISNSVVDTTVCASELPFEWNGLSVTSAGIYQATLASSSGLLDSIVTLNLTVLEPTFTTISDTICYGESYTWAENGKTYTKSATVSVQYSSIYGCDSTITLHLTVLPANTETVVTEQFCFHDTFTWPLNGKSYNTSATDTVTLLDRHGCDSVVILQLTQLPHHETIIQDTICYGDTYLWSENGQSYSSSVVDSIVLPDSNGCDSVIFLHLTMLPEIPQTIYQDTICQGDKYTWYLTGQTYTTNTDTSVVLTNINGCDSVVRLMLYVRPIQETITNMTICYGESFEWEGNIYTTTTKRSLKYQDIYGCDSIVTLNLTVIPQIPTTTLYETICYGDTYVFADQICDSTATYTATLASKDGCDSTVTLHLTVLPEVPITQEYATICYGETYTWHAVTYNTSGDYTTTLLDANGCDSLITLHLTVLPEVPITQEYATICYGESYTWQGTTYNASGDYTTTLLDANGCDSLITLHLTVLPKVPITHLYDTICNGYTYTWQGTTYNTSGDYTTTLLDSNGCDSIVTLHLLQNRIRHANYKKCRKQW